MEDEMRSSEKEYYLGNQSRFKDNFSYFDEVAAQFTRQDLQVFKNSFKIFDKNNDGHIKTKEAKTLLQSLKQDPSDEAVLRLIKEFDINGNGTIEFIEFLRIMEAARMEDQTEEELVDIFRVLDQNGDGYISKADLRDVVLGLREKKKLEHESDFSHHEIATMITQGDLDGDGTINFEEFMKIVMTSV